MPTADRILSWALAVANDWRWLAIAWHLVLATWLIACGTRWRPSTRLLALFLIGPIASVALVAGVSGNPFNGLIFLTLAILLERAAVRLPGAQVTWAVTRTGLAGAALLTVGWAYPHFLRTDTWVEYAYASPFGLLPCPTLAVVMGITLIFDGFGSTRWHLLLSAAGVLYGVIGVFVLNVWLDSWLLAGAILLALPVVRGATPQRTPLRETAPSAAPLLSRRHGWR